MQWVTQLLAKHDGQNGGSKITIDMVGSQIQWWVEHNVAHREGLATTHNYRDLLISHNGSFMLGLNTLNRAGGSLPKPSSVNMMHFATARHQGVGTAISSGSGL